LTSIKMTSAQLILGGLSAAQTSRVLQSRKLHKFSAYLLCIIPSCIFPVICYNKDTKRKEVLSND
jgi:hypothetical protein